MNTSSCYSSGDSRIGKGSSFTGQDCIFKIVVLAGYYRSRDGLKVVDRGNQVTIP